MGKNSDQEIPTRQAAQEDVRWCVQTRGPDDRHDDDHFAERCEGSNKGADHNGGQIVHVDVAVHHGVVACTSCWSRWWGYAADGAARVVHGRVFALDEWNEQPSNPTRSGE